MRKVFFLISIYLTGFNLLNAQTCKYSLNGKDAPGTEPIIYEKSITPDDSSTICSLDISTNGDELIYIDKSKDVFYMKRENGEWTKPELMAFSKKTLTDIMYPKFSPDGKFISFVDGNSLQYGFGDIFKINRLPDSTWSYNIIKLPEPINSDKRDAGHCFTLDGTLYFTSGRTDSTGSNNILKATPTANGSYEIEVLGDLSVYCIETDEECLYVSPHEEYLITDSWRKKSKHKHDLFISYKLDNNGWSELTPLNSKINTENFEQAPFVSGDNEYLFFARNNKYYWVSTKEVFVPYLNLQIPDFYERVNQDIFIEFSKNTFKDFNGEIANYKLTVQGTNKIPTWLKFDNNNLVLSGKPERAAILTCIITATDNDGNSVMADFKLIIEN